MKVLLINSDEGPDYLADLINYYFITGSYELFTNHRLDFLFDDYGNKENLYGKGFTLYGKLSQNSKKNITVLSSQQIKDSINDYDQIIFTSIQRKVKNSPVKEDLFWSIHKNLKLKNIIVVDGEDNLKIDQNIADKSLYFKRELIKKNISIAKPISFSFPKYEITKSVKTTNEKSQLLAPMDPRYLNSYIFDEKSYFDQYARSLFGVTIKKAGWDCMRHYEILSQNTLLYFPGIIEKPELTMSEFPLDLQLETNSLFESLLTGDSNIDSVEKIRLRYYTKNYALRSIKRVKTKLTKLNLIENNINKIETLNNEFQNWFQKNGTTAIYKKILDL